MIIRIGPKPYLFHNDLAGLGFYLFLFLFLLVKKLLIINNLTNRWICLWGDLYQVQIHLIRHFQGFRQRINALVFNIFTNNAYSVGPYSFVNPVREPLFLAGNISSSSVILFASYN